MDGSDLTSPMLDAIDEPAGDVDVFDVGYELMLLAKNGLKSWATKRRRKKNTTTDINGSYWTEKSANFVHCYCSKWEH